MNSLGSWIDRAELDRLVGVIGSSSSQPTSAASSEAPSPSPQQGTPFPWNRPVSQTNPSAKTVSAVPNLARPSTPERFPVAEEVEKFRVKVAAIKDKARSLGVLSPGTQASPQSADSPLAGAYVPPTRTPKLKSGQAPSNSPIQTLSTPEFRVPQGPLRLRLECFGEWAATLTRAQAVVVADSQGDLVFERGASGAWISSVTLVASAGERASRHLPISGTPLIHIDLPADRKLAILPCLTKFGHLSVGLVVPKAIELAQARSIAEAISAVVARQ